MSSVLLPPFTLRFRIRPARVTPGTSIFLRTSARMESSTAAKLAADSNNNGQDSGNSAAEAVVQYVVLRRDLIDSWPLGSVVTQGCHASVAAIWAHKDDPDTLLYCSPPNIDSMHKVSKFYPCFFIFACLFFGHPSFNTSSYEFRLHTICMFKLSLYSLSSQVELLGETSFWSLYFFICNS